MRAAGSAAANELDHFQPVTFLKQSPAMFSFRHNFQVSLNRYPTRIVGLPFADDDDEKLAATAGGTYSAKKSMPE